MAYQVSNTSIVQLLIRGRYANQETMNVIHLFPVDPPAGDIADGLANLEQIIGTYDVNPGGWSDLLSKCCHENFTIDWIQAQYVWPTRMAYLRRVAEVTSGTLVGTEAPPNTSAVITYQGDGVGRHQRGNQHIGGLRAEDITEGRIALTLADDMRTLGEFLAEPTLPLDVGFAYEMCIFQRGAPAASAAVTHLTVQSTSRVERRRTVGLGT